MRGLILLVFIVQSYVGFSQSNFKVLKSEFLAFRQAGDQDSALSTAKRMHRLALQEQGDTSYWYALSARYIGNPFYSQQNMDSCIFYWEKSAELFSEYHPEHTDYAVTLNNLGILHYDFGNYQKAEEYFLLNLDIPTKSKYLDTINYDNKLNDLALFYFKKNKFQNALKYYELSLQNRELIKDKMKIANTMFNVGLVHYHLYNHELAIEYFKNSLEIRTIELGYSNSIYTDNYNMIALAYLGKEDFWNAEKFSSQALNAYEQSNNLDPIKLATLLNTYGNILKELGNLDKSLTYYKRELNLIRSKSLDIDSSFYAGILYNIGDIYVHKFDYKNAILYHKKSLKIRQNYIEYEPYNYVASLNSLGIIHTLLEEWSKSEMYYLKALDLMNEFNDESSDWYGNLLNNLGFIYEKQQNYTEAEKYYTKSLILSETFLVKNHSSYITSLNNVSRIKFEEKKYQKSLQLMLESFSLNKEIIIREFEWLNDTLVTEYWALKNSYFLDIPNFAAVVSPYQVEFAALAYDAALFSKSRLLEKKRLDKSFKNNDPLINELATYNLALQMYAEDSEFDRALYKQLKSYTDSLELVVQMKHPEYKELKRNLNINWRDVQQGMRMDQVAIEFTIYLDQNDNAYKYGALLVKPNLEFPQFIPLCSEEQLTTFLQENHPGEIANARILYQWLWHPLVAHLDNSQEVFYSTSGILNEIPFHTLVSSERNQPLKFVMDRFDVHRLTSTRYLYQGFNKSLFESQQPTVSLVGGVDFYNLPSTTLAQTSSRKKRFVFRGNNDPGESLENIPATLDEVQKIQGLMDEARWSTDILFGDQATEENLMSLLNQSTPNILHVATHGFSFESPHDKPLNLTLQERFNYRYSADPMERSGIILAGGNWKWIGNDTLHIMQKRDGILNAKETSTLNLKGCQLAVLSACQTALGDVDDTEGTFGIVRGFKLAGVDQLIVSLWKVPDEQTSEFMQEFYKVLVQNKDIPSSFRIAQNTMREKYPTNPRLWAAFVLVR